jgi:hypothetical protein
MGRTDFLPGAVVLPGYTAERQFTGGVKVWNDRGKLFVRVPIEGDHPLQVEINILDKTYDVCLHD